MAQDVEKEIAIEQDEYLRSVSRPQRIVSSASFGRASIDARISLRHRRQPNADQRPVAGAIHLINVDEPSILRYLVIQQLSHVFSGRAVAGHSRHGAEAGLHRRQPVGGMIITKFYQ